MTDDTADTRSETLTRARGYLRGERSESGGSVQPQVIVEALREEIAANPTGAPVMLVRLAGCDDAEDVMELVFRETSPALANALGQLPLQLPEKYMRPLEAVIYLVLRLAPDDSWVPSSCNQISDPALFGRLLTWAAAEPEYNPAGWHVGAEPAPDSIWRFAAQAFLRRGGHHDWSRCKPCRQAATRLAAAVPVPALTEGCARVGLDPREAAYALDDLDLHAARAFAAHLLSLRAEILRDLEDAKRSLEEDRWGRTGRDAVGKGLRLLPLDDLDSRALVAGRLVAAELVGRPCDAASIAKVVRRPVGEISGRLFAEVVDMWAQLEALARYEQKSWEHATEIEGVLADLSESVGRSARAWALSAEDILRTTTARGTHAIDLLSLACLHHPEVRRAVESVGARGADVNARDRARGVIARTSGVVAPDEAVRRWLADTAARALDGMPFVPHPLSPLARTWLGAIDVEEALRRGVRRASGVFEGRVRDQGRAEEEALTMALLTELEVAFRDVSLALTSGGRQRIADAISIAQRPVPKSEEARWGCDLALLLKAHIPGALSFDLAELVQVKKSQALVGASRNNRAPDTWRIDTAQLTTLLRLSDASAYWLILSTGEVACVPARLLSGMGRGREALTQGTFSVGYSDIRHAAIPLEQFIPDLFVGSWVGSSSDATLTFAAGDHATLRPRHIVTISVEPSQE